MHFIIRDCVFCAVYILVFFYFVFGRKKLPYKSWKSLQKEIVWIFANHVVYFQIKEMF